MNENYFIIDFTLRNCVVLGFPPLCRCVMFVFYFCVGVIFCFRFVLIYIYAAGTLEGEIIIPFFFLFSLFY
jgi:hypothetical protein